MRDSIRRVGRAAATLTLASMLEPTVALAQRHSQDAASAPATDHLAPLVGLAFAAAMVAILTINGRIRGTTIEERIPAHVVRALSVAGIFVGLLVAVR